MKKKILLATFCLLMATSTTACSFAVGDARSEQEIEEYIQSEVERRIEEELSARLDQAVEDEINRREQEANALKEEEIKSKEWLYDDDDTSSTSATDKTQEDKNTDSDDTSDIDDANDIDDSDVSDTDDSDNDSEDIAVDNYNAIMELYKKEVKLYEQEDGIENTKNIYETDKEIIALNTYDFTGKNVVFIGDSITYGSGGTLDEDGTCICYPDFLSDTLGCRITNLATPGFPLGAYDGNSCVRWLADVIPSDADIIVIMCGFNDYYSYNQYYVSDSEELGTFKGETHAMFKKIRDTFPDKEVFVVSTYQNKGEGSAVNASTPFSSFVNYQKDEAWNYDFNIIDLYNTGFLNNHNDDIYNAFFSDSVHLNDDGSKLLGKHIAAQMVRVMVEKEHNAQ